MNPNKLIKITLTINYALQEEALSCLKNLQTPYVLMQSARSAIIPPTKFLAKRLKLKDEQQCVFEFYVPYELELLYMQTLIEELALLVPGRGSVISQAVVFYAPIYEHVELETARLKKQVIEQILSAEMQVLSLVCPRDEANSFSQSLLMRGYPSPVISYGTGMGTRSRMGLLRITIPPEKEVLQIPIHYKDSQFVLQLLAQQARIDLPGKGFLTHNAIRYAKINTKTHNDDPSRLASIEQIISAIDTLQGGVEWRRKNITSIQSHSSLRENKMIQLTFNGTRGISEIVTAIAFEMGGRGATMHRKSFYEFGQHHEEFSENHERESCNITLPSDIAAKMILHIAQELKWQEVGLSSIEEHEIYHVF